MFDWKDDNIEFHGTKIYTDLTFSLLLNVESCLGFFLRKSVKFESVGVSAELVTYWSEHSYDTLQFHY